MPYMIGFVPKGRIANIKVAAVPTARMAHDFVHDLRASNEEILHITTPDGREIELSELELRAARECR